MIFDLRENYIPDVYTTSEEYNVFLRLLSFLCTTLKYDIDSIPQLYSIDKCPDNLLQYLADLIGYEYDTTLSPQKNRQVMTYLPYLIRNRGSEVGIRLASALAVNTSTSDTTEITKYVDFRFAYDYATGVVTVYYPASKDLQSNLVYLLNKVRPIGVTLKYVPYTALENPKSEAVLIYDEINADSSDYNPERAKVNSNYKVNFTTTNLDKEET